MKIIKPILDNKSGYYMRLANGQGWHIMAAEGVRSWVEKLACIMELDSRETEGYPKLIFIRRGKDKEKHGEPIGSLGPNMQRDLPRNGWKPHDISKIRLWSRPDATDVICEIGNGDENLDIVMMRHSLYPIYQRAQDSGGLPFHAGLIGRDGKGILLAAPRGTGKSTCCRRIQKPWYALCDEETLVVQGDQKRYLVHPFPTWSDYLRNRSEGTWNIQRNLPLYAVVFLEQAEADELVSIGQGEAAALMYQSATQVCYRDWVRLPRKKMRTIRKKLFDNACELARRIPVFKLRVSLTGRFWEKIEATLP